MAIQSWQVARIALFGNNNASVHVRHHAEMNGATKEIRAMMHSLQVNSDEVFSVLVTETHQNENKYRTESQDIIHLLLFDFCYVLNE